MSHHHHHNSRSARIIRSSEPPTFARLSDYPHIPYSSSAKFCMEGVGLIASRLDRNNSFSNSENEDFLKYSICQPSFFLCSTLYQYSFHCECFEKLQYENARLESNCGFFFVSPCSAALTDSEANTMNNREPACVAPGTCLGIRPPSFVRLHPQLRKEYV